jgi:hypothetical protein
VKELLLDGTEHVFIYFLRTKTKINSNDISHYTTFAVRIEIELEEMSYKFILSFYYRLWNQN